MSATLTQPNPGVGPRGDQVGSAERTFNGGGALIGCYALGCTNTFVQTTGANRYCSPECKDATRRDADRVRRGALDLSDGDRLEHLYVDLGHSVEDIARMAEVSESHVRRMLNWHAIPSRGRGRPERAIVDLMRRRRFDDRNNPPAAALVAHRISAVKDALLAVVHEQDDEDPIPVGIRRRSNTYPLRDALIDLAAAAIAYADELPAPDTNLGDPL